jgi:hypothetical protein
MPSSRIVTPVAMVLLPSRPWALPRAQSTSPLAAPKMNVSMPSASKVTVNMATAAVGLSSPLYSTTIMTMEARIKLAASPANELKVAAAF